MSNILDKLSSREQIFLKSVISDTDSVLDAVILDDVNEIKQRMESVKSNYGKEVVAYHIANDIIEKLS